MADVDSKGYQHLYNLQDQVLEAVSELEIPLYLTGGTCLHRFYIHKRYSDDLDFFCNDNALFRDYLLETEEAFQKAGLNSELFVDTRDFRRITVNALLKVDFVNDRVFRFGRTQVNDSGYRLDNPENILANKITAVLGRDEPKDIFDIYTISMFTDPDWQTIISAAQKKSLFEKDMLLDRLRSFPVNLLDALAVSDRADIDRCREALPGIIDAISDGFLQDF